MAIIRPSKKFAGSEINNSDAGKYIKPDVRQVLFNKNMNKDGAWLYFLPAYKADNEGFGVWYKVIKVRDNFGDKYKDKYVVLDPASDPVAHFERNFKLYYPEDAKPVDEQTDAGTRKRYPSYGRVTSRVIYNVAYVNDLEKGSHILDLPAFNGASLIDSWLAGKDTKGKDRPVLNDPEACIPVFIKLKSDKSGTPWQIEPEQRDAAEIPQELADSDYLYNLDDIYIVKSKDELIGKLGEWYRGDVFDQCMEGYPGFDNVVVQGHSLPKASPAPATTPAPKANAPRPSRPAPATLNIAKVNPSVAAATATVETVEEVAQEVVESETNPLAGVSSAKAREFLMRK